MWDLSGVGSTQVGSILSFGLRWADFGARGSGLPSLDAPSRSQSGGAGRIWVGCTGVSGSPHKICWGYFCYYSCFSLFQLERTPVLGTQLPSDTAPVPEIPWRAKLLLCAGTQVAHATRRRGKFQEEGKASPQWVFLNHFMPPSSPMPLEIKVIFFSLLPCSPCLQAFTAPLCRIPLARVLCQGEGLYSWFLPFLEEDLEWKPPEHWRLKDLAKSRLSGWACKLHRCQSA